MVKGNNGRVKRRRLWFQRIAFLGMAIVVAIIVLWTILSMENDNDYQQQQQQHQRHLRKMLSSAPRKTNRNNNHNNNQKNDSLTWSETKIVQDVINGKLQLIDLELNEKALDELLWKKTSS